MKEFNLERALAGDPVVTRDGRKVNQVVSLDSDIDYPVFAIIYDRDRGDSFTIDGKIIINSESEYDLFMQPVKKEGWINIYGDSDKVYGRFKTKEEAISRACDGCVDTIKIEWEE